MSLQIIYGRSKTGKTSYIFKEISQNIEDGRKKYIITPEQFSFTAEKELLKALESKNTNNSNIAVVNAEVLTFARMAHRVSTEVGGSSKTILSECGKAMLVYSILSKKKNNLKFLGKSDNNIDMIMTQITELKIEIEKGIYDVDTKTVSGIDAYNPGYLIKDDEVIVGFQTDAPFRLPDSCIAFFQEINTRQNGDFPSALESVCARAKSAKPDVPSRCPGRCYQ